MAEEEFQKNVLGEKLETCSINPLTGWYRDGCCNTDENDFGAKYLPSSTSFILSLFLNIIYII